MILSQETEVKLTILKKYLPWFIAAPYTRAIFLSGSIAAGCPKPESDIDLVVVAQKNRVWLNRFFLELITWLLGRRRDKHNFKNKFCFNIFLSNQKTFLPHQDFVGASCYKFLKPAWAADQSEIKIFWQTNNWIEKFFPLSPQSQNLIFSSEGGFVSGEQNNYKKINFLRKSLEFVLIFFWLSFIFEKIFYAVQKTYLTYFFKKSGGYKNSQADFYLSPHLIAYHFPVSNYSRAVKKHKEQF